MRLHTGSAMKLRSKWKPWVYELQRTADVECNGKVTPIYRECDSDALAASRQLPEFRVIFPGDRVDLLARELF